MPNPKDSCCAAPACDSKDQRAVCRERCFLTWLECQSPWILLWILFTSTLKHQEHHTECSNNPKPLQCEKCRPSYHMDIQQQPKAQNEHSACAPFRTGALVLRVFAPLQPAGSVTPNAVPAAGTSGTEPASDTDKDRDELSAMCWTCSTQLMAPSRAQRAVSYSNTATGRISAAASTSTCQKLCTAWVKNRKLCWEHLVTEENWGHLPALTIASLSHRSIAE